MIRIEVKGIPSILKMLDPKKVDKAAKSALVRVRAQAKTEAVRSMSKVWNISKRDLEYKSTSKPRIETSGYVGNDLTAHIYFMSGGISLAYFGATEFRFKGNALVKVNRKMSTVGKRGRKSVPGVAVKPLPGVAFKPLRGGKVTRLKAFFAAVGYGKNRAAGFHMGVFSRHSHGKRTKIYERKMISVATMIRKPQVMQPLQKFIKAKWDERIKHELKRQGLTK